MPAQNDRKRQLRNKTRHLTRRKPIQSPRKNQERYCWTNNWPIPSWRNANGRVAVVVQEDKPENKWHRVCLCSRYKTSNVNSRRLDLSPFLRKWPLLVQQRPVPKLLMIWSSTRVKTETATAVNMRKITLGRNHTKTPQMHNRRTDKDFTFHPTSTVLKIAWLIARLIVSKYDWENIRFTQHNWKHKTN